MCIGIDHLYNLLIITVCRNKSWLQVVLVVYVMQGDRKFKKATKGQSVNTNI